jgi:hypothetical protein
LLLQHDDDVDSSIGREGTGETDGGGEAGRDPSPPGEQQDEGFD